MLNNGRLFTYFAREPNFDVKCYLIENKVPANYQLLLGKFHEICGPVKLSITLLDISG